MYNSKSHPKAEIEAAAQQILAGKKGVFLVEVDSGAAGLDDVCIIEASEAEIALKKCKSIFADFLDISPQEMEEWTEESARNRWAFRVIDADEI
jgi:hypothetical protein